MKTKIWITIIGILIALFGGQWWLYKRDREDWLIQQEKHVNKIKEEKQAFIDSLVLQSQNDKVIHDEEVEKLLRKNTILNGKIWNYENNPNFDDFNFMERAHNVAKYKYRPEE